MDAMLSIRNNVAESIAKNIQKPDCGWQGRGNNKLYFLTIHLPAQPGIQCIADLAVKLPAPYRKFYLVSCTQGGQNNNLFLHLSPIGKNYPVGTSGITPDGTEAWFSMKNRQGTVTMGSGWEFESGVDQLYFDAGFEVGGGTSWTVTIACVNDDNFKYVPFIQIDSL